MNESGEEVEEENNKKYGGEKLIYLNLVRKIISLNEKCLITYLSIFCQIFCNFLTKYRQISEIYNCKMVVNFWSSQSPDKAQY